MSDHHARSARDDVYDHEDQEPRSGRRRRPVADWGVGEDMFEQMPRNRFSRTAEGPPRERRFAREDAERPPAATTPSAPPGASRIATAPASTRSTPRPAAPRAARAAARTTAGARSGLGKPEDVPSEIAAVTADRDLGPDEGPSAARGAGGGRSRRAAPSGSAAGPRARWRPPATSATVRAGARRAPRTSASAPGPTASPCGRSRSGMLLIVIAILTAM